MKKLNLFQKFDFASWQKEKKFMVQGIKYNEKKGCVSLDVIIVEDNTDYGDAKFFENDKVITSEYANDNKKYKVETDGMTNEEVVIALLAKQTLYMKTIKNIVVTTFILSVLGAIAIFI